MQWAIVCTTNYPNREEETTKIVSGNELAVGFEVANILYFARKLGATSFVFTIVQGKPTKPKE